MRSADWAYLLIAPLTLFSRARASRPSFENRSNTPMELPRGSLYGGTSPLHAKSTRSEPSKGSAPPATSFARQSRAPLVDSFGTLKGFRTSRDELRAAEPRSAHAPVS